MPEGAHGAPLPNLELRILIARAFRRLRQVQIRRAHASAPATPSDPGSGGIASWGRGRPVRVDESEAFVGSGTCRHIWERWLPSDTGIARGALQIENLAIEKTEKEKKTGNRLHLAVESAACQCVR